MERDRRSSGETDIRFPGPQNEPDEYVKEWEYHGRKEKQKNCTA